MISWDDVDEQREGEPDKEVTMVVDLLPRWISRIRGAADQEVKTSTRREWLAGMALVYSANRNVCQHLAIWHPFRLWRVTFSSMSWHFSLKHLGTPAGVIW